MLRHVKERVIFYAVPGFLLLGSRGRAAFPPLKNAVTELENLRKECGEASCKNCDLNDAL